MAYDILTKDEPVLLEDVEASSETIEYRLEFTGNAGEYFRIWIVNTFLTIITLGIYAAWAKVRTRQYFYAHTRLAGQPFEYLANPRAILRGNLIIGGGFLLYMALRNYNLMLAGGIIILFYLFLPFLIYKTLRFYAHNSAFRNIRFRFLGSLKESYIIFMLIPLVIFIPPVLGLVAFKSLQFSLFSANYFFVIPLSSLVIAAITLPYCFFRQKKYFFEHIAFGASPNYFYGKPKFFYRVYLIASAIMIGFFAIIGRMLYVLIPHLPQGSFNPIALWVINPLILIGIILVQQYTYSRTNNYCWENSKLRIIRFESTLSASELMWLRLSNIAAIICSVGLLIPWAKVRSTRYTLDHLIVFTQGSLDEFTGAATVEDSAIGEVATDVFDIEIGL